MTKGVDSATKNWIRNASDEIAARNGFRFDEERAQFAVDWIERYCILYEGEFADEPMTLSDWQLDCTKALFGWVGFSDHWKREIRRFREASIWVPKKNKKSPTLAAWGLYMLIGDGESGQKVFLAAKDGKQARDIGGKHAMEMLKRSPELSADCHFNMSTYQITYLPTASIMLPLSSGNDRHAQAKEGLNGSVLIDETHVVDRPFVNRINRAGISRAEPLHLEVSTAGNNPAGYGKERFDEAQRIIDGKSKNDRLFAAIYAVPQDITAEQIAEDPLKYGRMANPAMGHTVNPEEFLADYERSKDSITKMQDFMMYRLNKWCASASPWLKPGDWSGCYEPFEESDLEGHVCYGGLDLAWVKDFASLVLVFPEGDGRYKQLAWFWLPEETARERSHLASYLQWANDDHIRLIPGKTINRRAIIGDICEIINRFSMRKYAYDPLKADEYVEEIESATGAEAFAFKQGIMNFATPTAAYERLVIDKRLKHNGHPVLTWQAGHVQVYRDPNGGMRPTRKDKDDHFTIDGIVAGIMGLAMTLDQEQNGGSAYDHHEVYSF